MLRAWLPRWITCCAQPGRYRRSKRAIGIPSENGRKDQARLTSKTNDPDPVDRSENKNATQSSGVFVMPKA